MELRSPGPFLDHGLSRFCRMKPRLPIQGSLFEASIAGLEQVHGVCDLQISKFYVHYRVTLRVIVLSLILELIIVRTYELFNACL